MQGILIGLVLFLLHAVAAAAEISVVGLTAGKAVVIINKGKPRAMAAGQVAAEGVKLIEATSESATFEVNGKRQTLTLGQSISVGGGPVNAPVATVGSDPVGVQGTTLVADSGGHFRTTAAVNGVTLGFMVDTGASLVTLSSGDAKRAGINYLAGQKAMLQTANGVTLAYRVKLDTVRLGDITLNNVDGAVVEGNLLGEQGLLGLSFLNRLNMRREGSTMTLTRRF